MLIIVPGTRVRLKYDVERFPDFIAPAGFLGTVTHMGGGSLWVRLDLPLAGAEEWENAIQFTMEHGDVLPEALEVIA